MKLAKSFLAGLATCSLALAAFAEDTVKFNVPGVGKDAAPAATSSAPAASAAAPIAAAPKFTEAQLMESYGWLMGARMGLAELEFTPAQVESMAKGMRLVAAGQPPPYPGEQVGPELEALLAKKNQSFLGKLRSQNLAEAASFFTKLKENKNVQELASGLRYEILKAGSGAYPKVGQQAKIHYTGTFINGQTFDSSIQRGQPAEMIIKDGSIIAGMAEGLQKINVGGKIKLYVPPHLAYGDEGIPGGIPPAATLIFEVELLEVKDAPPEAPAAK